MAVFPMEQEKQKQDHTEDALKLPADFREEQYLHTVASEKRHELLMAPYGVSFPVFRTLVYLMQHPDGAAPSQIADDLMILRQSMTNIVDSLEKQSLVERSAHPNDHRRIIVRLLPKGLSLARTLFQIENDYTQRIYRHFTKQELEDYYRLMRKMHEVKELELNQILKEYEAGHV